MNSFTYSSVKTDELMLIRSRHLIKRYNQALNILNGKETQLDAFHIDCTGYSPEIARELNNPDYLSPEGISKQFIIISMDQERYPIARCHFSSTYDFFREFFHDNRKALMTLTSLDVVFGELENNIYRVETISDVINADTVHFVIDTPKRLIRKADQLSNLVTRFIESDDEGWVEDAVYEEAIELANQVGNINHNTIKASSDSYKKSAYFTSHFGGIYIFKSHDSNARITLILMDPEASKLTIPQGVTVIDGTNCREVHKYLLSEGYLESLTPSEYDIDRLRDKKYQIILDTMAYQHHVDINQVDNFHIKQFVQENYNSLPEVFHQLKSLVVSAERDEQRIYHSDSVLFYTSKVSEKEEIAPYYSLVNHLVANYTPHSYLRMFTFNRELYVREYLSWPESKRTYVDKYICEHIEIIEALRRKASANVEHN